MKNTGCIAAVDWSQPVSLWHKGLSASAARPGTWVAEGPLGAVVSRAVALNPIERNDLVIIDDAGSVVLDWRQILELECRQDFPFSI